MKKLLLLLSTTVLLGSPAGLASATTCFYAPELDPLPDETANYMICFRPLNDDHWARFSFDEGDWDDGFGFGDGCNLDKPLARTYSAMTLLEFSGTNTPTCSTSSPNMLEWAYCWAGAQIDEVDGRCYGDPGQQAYTRFGPIIDNYTRLYWPFFYNASVVERASILVHEARHAQGWCDHYYNSSCLNGASCDYQWDGGCGGYFSSGGQGTNTFQVDYLWWFATSATWTDDYVKSSAIGVANFILARQFAHDPCFRLDENGWSYQAC